VKIFARHEFKGAIPKAFDEAERRAHRLAHMDLVARIVRIVGNAAGVREQVMDGDPAPRRWGARDVFRDRIFNPEHSLFLKLKNRSGGELFRNRAQAKFGFGLVGYVEFDVGNAIPLREDDLAIFREEDGTPGCLQP